MSANSAIPTRFMGYHFRSRLEARWAVFLRALGVTFEYEPEGFNFGAFGCYLPDFFLPDVHLRCGNRGLWLEIKPAVYDPCEGKAPLPQVFPLFGRETPCWSKYEALGRATGYGVAVACGMPQGPEGPNDSGEVFEFYPI